MLETAKLISVGTKLIGLVALVVFDEVGVEMPVGGGRTWKELAVGSAVVVTTVLGEF
jgi:hypothetical protein